MSEIPDDIMSAAFGALWGFRKRTTWVSTKADEEEEMKAAVLIGKAISAERNRCLSILKSIEPHNEAEAHLIETIVRKMRGDE